MNMEREKKIKDINKVVFKKYRQFSSDIDFFYFKNILKYTVL